MTLPTQRTILAVTVVLLLGIFGLVALNPFTKPVPLSLIERCEQKGGEWLYNSERRVCILGDGTWLQYSLSEDDFVRPQDSAPVALAAELEPQIGDGWSDEVGACADTPSFEDYAVPSIYEGPLATVDFSTNEAAAHHRTAIRKDMIDVNFAGEYVLSTWGCGKGCYGMAIIDGQTGEIYEYGATSMKPFVYQDDSALLARFTKSGIVYAVFGEEGELRDLCRDEGV